MMASSGAAATGAVASDSARQTPVKRLLLVVEDNPGDVRLLREMLHAQGSHDSILTQVESMGEAERYLTSGTVDVILLDLGLPDAQGLDAVRRAHAAAPHIPLVVLTRLDDESLAVQALQEGAQDYLIKGQIESRSLLRALRYAIERKVLEDGRRAGESQLLQAQKLESVGRLAGGIAHDFNNMLFAISGYAELLTQDLVAAHPSELDRSGLLQSVKAISDAAKRAGALTGQLLAFSRQQMVVAQVVDMNAAITTIAPMIRQLIGEHLRLTLDLDPGAGRILADPSQIDQILVNLVVNARDAMPAGGTVTIKTGTASASHADLADLVTDAAAFVSMEVTDTGVGMDLATREHMFEPFFTTKDIGKGTGLGLATTHGIVDQAGGRIKVRSEPGQGSTFRLFFPRVTDSIEAGPAIQDMHVAGVGRVLVVEDDAAVREMVGRLLERAGYDVLEATDGVEAMAVTRLKPPLDAIVTDVVMPNMSGVALAEAMIDRYPSIGVVLLSGYAPDHLDLERVMAQGAIFVAKPVSAEGLMQAVRVAVDASRVGPPG